LTEAGLPALGVILDVLDEDALRFYQHYELFESFTDDPMRLFVSMHVLKQMIEYNLLFYITSRRLEQRMIAQLRKRLCREHLNDRNEQSFAMPHILPIMGSLLCLPLHLTAHRIPYPLVR
jgi:hypothetical protein